MSVKQRVMVDSETIQSVGHSPDHYGAVYSIETIRQGRPTPTKEDVANVYTSEYRLHVSLLQFQGFMSQIRQSFLHRIRNQLSNEYRYYSFEPGINLALPYHIILYYSAFFR